jgi:hypothetical protein
VSERITEAELSDIVGRIEHAWQHNPGRPDFIERLRLIAEVRRLRTIITGARLDLHREAKAIHEERGFK